MTGPERPETQVAMDRIMDALDDEELSPFRRKLLSLQVITISLLIALVLVTVTSFALVMNSEREARDRSIDRSARFEAHVTSILDSIEDTQEVGRSDRQEIQILLEDIRNLIEEENM